MGIRSRIRHLSEQNFLRAGVGEAADHGREFQGGYEKFPETVPVRWVVHLGWSEIFGVALPWKGICWMRFSITELAVWPSTLAW